MLNVVHWLIKKKNKNLLSYINWEKNKPFNIRQRAFIWIWYEVISNLSKSKCNETINFY